MFKLRPLVSLALGLATLACSGDADAQAAWYDPAPLLASVRPEAQTAARAVVGDLATLPLYELRLELAEDLGSFELSEDVYVQNTFGTALRELVFRVYANRGQAQPPVSLVEARCEGQPCMTGWDPSGVLTLTPRTPLAEGARLRVHIQLRGTLKAIDARRTNLLAQAMEGMNRMQASAPAGDYGLLAHGDGVASLTRFYAVLARRRAGGWVREEANGLGDVAPDRLSHVRATVVTAPGVVVAASGQVTSPVRMIVAGQPGRQEVQVVAGLVRDFAVLASSRFQVATQQVGDVELRSVFVRGDEDAGARVLVSAAHAFRTFERRFGPYPYRRLDLVEAPLVGGAGGVEFSGLVTVASMFYRPITGSAGTGGAGGLGSLAGLLAGGGLGQAMVEPMLEFVTAHEVSHQWWSGLVGSDAREHPFVDESLAQYSAALAMEDRYGRARATQEMTRQVAQNYQMMRTSGHPDGRVDRPARDFPSELEYAGLVYGKGPFFYREARRAMGDEAFFAALRRYATDNAFRVATPVDLRRAFTRGRHRRRVRRLFARYFEQSHGDEDLGQADQGALMGQWLGGAGGAGGLLQGLLGQLGSGGATPGDSPADGAGAQDTAAAFQEAVREIETLGQGIP
ncbi:MAG: M1 family metallopeptidase [Deltaproteobacteria bacterium]|nr:M1 family metallopeptidase [Deltaproteobacteria bacterium]